LTKPKRTLTWEDTPDGNYYVKTGYHAIIEWEETSNTNLASSSGSMNDMWVKLWKLQVPLKHCNLTWRILNNVVYVKKNLFQRGVRCDSLCPRCQNHAESVTHAFLYCVWAQQVWLASPLSINLSSNQFDNIFDWFEHMFRQAEKETMETIIAITYGIWNAINLMVFQDKYLPPTYVSSAAIAQLQEYKSIIAVSHKPHDVPPSDRSSNNIGWSPTP
jgi:hypothetical protein